MAAAQSTSVEHNIGNVNDLIDIGAFVDSEKQRNEFEGVTLTRGRQTTHINFPSTTECPKRCAAVENSLVIAGLTSGL